MKTLVIFAFLLSISTCANSAELPTILKSQTKPQRFALLCFFQYEQTGGMNKICYYDCLGSTVAITLSAISICPININR